MTNTVYVVGAGASHDLDETMPIGSQLAERIQKTLYEEAARPTTDLGAIGTVLATHGGFDGDHQRAMRRIANGIGSVDSIDQFVDQCQGVPHLALVAKLAIAHQIGLAEQASILAQHHNQPNPIAFNALRNKWLGLICRYNNRPANRQDFYDVFDGITFVTYNYDRCIEEFLYQWAYLTLGATEFVARLSASNVPVHHIYGSLGDPFEDGQVKCPFGAPSTEALWHAGNSIRTFTEEIGSENLDKVRAVIAAAERVVFLGSAYHHQNLSILWPAGPIARQRIYGTTYMMRDRSRAATRAWFKGAHDRVFKPQNCSEFMFELQDELFL